jgi:hypothetical protein
MSLGEQLVCVDGGISLTAAIAFVNHGKMQESLCAPPRRHDGLEAALAV